MSFERTITAAQRFAPPGHFYSPHPRLEDLEENHAAVLKASREAGGLDLNDAEQLQLFNQAVALQAVGPWKPEAVPALRFHYENGFFRFGDSNAIWHMAQLFRPKRVIEVGSGYSTACWLDTFDSLGLETRITCVEPYPDRVHSLCRPEDILGRIALHQRPVQEIPVDVFRELSANDVLFIDSTHVSKCGSDVNYLIFQVLPALAPGVLVHVHDIFWPFDYPLDWYLEGRAWNESFVLRAFLQFNSVFRIIRFNSYLAEKYPAQLERSDRRFVGDAGGSLWLRKAT